MGSAVGGGGATNTGRRRRLRTLELKNEIDDFRQTEETTRARFDLRLAELQSQLRRELSRLPKAEAARLMQGQDELLNKPDFSKPAKWDRPANFAEIFEQNPG